MYRRMQFSVLGLLVVLACEQPPSAPSADALNADGLTAGITAAKADALPDHAEVTFGREKQGTDFFPPGSHDGSFHAKDAIRPRVVVIRAGGTVTFNVAAAHKIAIYQPGTDPRDIDVTSLEPPGTPFPFPPIINDPNGRIVRGTLAFGPPVPFTWTFDQPGKYLVICEVLPHFADARMYAWVDVK